MGQPRGSSTETKAEILGVARDLFARQGLAAVSVRRVAAAAGVDHALVHRYFGTRDELIGATIRAEVEAASRRTGPEVETADPRERIRRVLRYYLTEGRTSVLLVARAELAGLAPEALLAPGAPRALGLVTDELASLQAQGSRPRHDPALLGAVAGAALMGFVTVAPWLMTGVGLAPEDFEARLDEIVDIVVDLLADPDTRGMAPD